MPEPILILEADQLLAHQKIAEIEQALRDMGPEIAEALDQSSETWHDNAPFEVLRDRRSAYLNDITNIKAILGNATKQVPRTKRGVAGVGSTVEVRNARTGKTHCYYIAGDWTLRTGELHEGAVVISRQSPLGRALLGKRAGDAAAFNNQSLTVLQVW